MTSQENFADRLTSRMQDLKSRICVGLDPDLNRFPEQLLKEFDLTPFPASQPDEDFFSKTHDCILEFNRQVIEAVDDLAVAIKPQSAHYERFGWQGVKALAETVAMARDKGILVILDGKRNDIGSTAEKYGCAYLGSESGPGFAGLPSDALTVNPYLGSDGILPFVELCKENGRGIFVLVKTSNPSSKELQDLKIADSQTSWAAQVGQLVEDWGQSTIGRCGYSSVGAVVGATHGTEIRSFRQLMPHTLFLMPGYGAQGAGAEDVKDAFGADGLGALINSSRGVIYAFNPQSVDFASQIRDSAAAMVSDIRNVI